MKFEKNCETCVYDGTVEEEKYCPDCTPANYNWQPSRLYKAYLAEKERAERFRRALNCEACGGEGYSFDDDNYKPCPECAEIRKEAEEGE